MRVRCDRGVTNVRNELGAAPVVGLPSRRARQGRRPSSSITAAHASAPSGLGVVAPRSQRESVEGSTSILDASSLTERAAPSRIRLARPLRNCRLTREILTMSTTRLSARRGES
jgi:hypothetical protein